MRTIKNPNDIVEEYVADYRSIFGDNLISVIMYGSAVTADYRPGRSDINTVVVLGDDSIAQIGKSLALVEKWRKRRVAVPFFMTRDFIAFSLDSYPLEFLDMQSNYRCLCEDVFLHLDIKHEHLRLQCERELCGASLHLRKEYLNSGGRPAALAALLGAAGRKLHPVFKGMLRLNNLPVPRLRDEVIKAVEDLYNLGHSALSEAAHAGMTKGNRDWGGLFDGYAKTIDALTGFVGSETAEGPVA